MKCYVVTLHDGGGSMGEAADAVAGFGLFTDLTVANAVADTLYKAIEPISSVHAQEWWATVQAIEVPTSVVTTSPSAAELSAWIARTTEEVSNAWDS